MKSFLELAARRKTTYEFSSKTVPEGLLDKILEAGRWAPSFLNRQPYNFLVVKNPKKIDAVLKAAYYGLFHMRPNAVILVVSSPSHASRRPHRGVVNDRMGRDDLLMCLAMPALMMSLEAEELELGSCLLSLDDSRLPPSLGLSKGQRSPLALGIGYPQKGADSTGYLHVRKPLSELVRRERL